MKTLEAVSYLLPHVPKGHRNAQPSLEDVIAQISKASSDRTLVRLVETMQFVLDVMGCFAPTSLSQPVKDSSATPKGDAAPSARLAALLPGGEGWRSAVRVRLLHGVARWRVQARWERERPTEAADGIPISQEEVAAT